MKKWSTLLLALALCLGLFTACGKDEIPDGPAELWVVTELTKDYGMNDQAERMIERFNETYPDVTVKLDILPTETEERAVYLQKLRTQIMGGSGPDAYIMPAYSIVPDPSSPYDNISIQVEPLFRDVNLAIENGAFYDISKYYDKDDALEKEELNASVMEGGVRDGCRFILPLRYDIGIYAVDREILEQRGYDTSLFQQDIISMLRTTLENGDLDMAHECQPIYYEWLFSELIDYSDYSVTLTQEEVAEYMKLYQTMLYEWYPTGASSTATADWYTSDGRYFAKDGFPISNISLTMALGSVATAKVLREEVELYPMLAPGGTLNACICYWAAVGAGSENPRLAYEFIRLFLSEEAQYESYLTSGKYRDAYEAAASAWPVRTVGSIAPRFEFLQFKMKKSNQMNVTITGQSMGGKDTDRREQFLAEDLTMTDEDVPALTWQVDEARFPVIYEYEDTIEYYLSLLNDAENSYAPTDVDIDALAQQYIDTLQFYLDEG